MLPLWKIRLKKWTKVGTRRQFSGNLAAFIRAKLRFTSQANEMKSTHDLPTQNLTLKFARMDWSEGPEPYWPLWEYERDIEHRRV